MFIVGAGLTLGTQYITKKEIEPQPIPQQVQEVQLQTTTLPAIQDTSKNQSLK